MSERPSGHDPDVMAAVAFAEVGEWDTARQLCPAAPGRLRAWLERHVVAAALAEEGLHEEAVRTARATAPEPTTERAADLIDALLAARGVRMLSGVAPAGALCARR